MALSPPVDIEYSSISAEPFSSIYGCKNSQCSTLMRRFLQLQQALCRSCPSSKSDALQGPSLIENLTFNSRISAASELQL
ncbi:hypothetical protein M758_5G080300 [Ceratodon purpureus]|nr:hypothetical protein M758_5G080300 [Ceratodon purpureus]